MKKLCVFCGSSFGQHPSYKDEILKFGKILGEKQIELIYGGGNAGLMGALSQAVLAHGGTATGIIPKKIYDQVEHIELSQLHIVDTMHERKNKMYELAEAFVALPGGIGTLEELAEIITWQQIGYHQKAIGIYNVNGFYDPFREMLKHMIAEGFLKQSMLDHLIVEDNVETLLERLDQFQPFEHSKWG
ncbi:hypothetical protein SAMN05421736_106120 [Evansella caseinilytica]|uniref:Cytokinin riboside 5'-monophosphate phosphoribohydrolase n=1 Tax=Evansella caseinilytica TaxID=1503961 RepID=A0A1H3QER6_9BACI|nr:TIGR00730 family Rossman fold protein [Evansella caseinilytica]SDZ11199.1 hypothetical protein SAMN05421736_106120 [Evansella caseinilytica]